MKVVIIGGRGNGTVIASTIEDCKSLGQDLELIGFLNDSEKEINGYKVLGGIKSNEWQNLDEQVKFIYALSNVKQAKDRYEILKKLEIPRERFATVIHPTSVVSERANLGKGVVLMPYVVVSPNVRIGDHSQMYAQSFVGHDSQIEEMVFVANNASIGGRVKVHNGAHIGSNSSILERLVIEQFSIIGLGSVVIKDVKENQIVVGNPARAIK